MTPKNGQHLAICWERLRDCPNNDRDCGEALHSRVLSEGEQRLSFEFHEFVNRSTFRRQGPGGVWARRVVFVFFYCAGAFGIVSEKYSDDTREKIICYLATKIRQYAFLSPFVLILRFRSFSTAYRCRSFLSNSNLYFFRSRTERFFVSFLESEWYLFWRPLWLNSPSSSCCLPVCCFLEPLK